MKKSSGCSIGRVERVCVNFRSVSLVSGSLGVEYSSIVLVQCYEAMVLRVTVNTKIMMQEQ